MSLLTVRQAAARLGVGYSTVKQWIYKGSVRTVRTDGGHYRIADAEVERLLARRQPTAATPHQKAATRPRRRARNAERPQPADGHRGGSTA